MCPAGWTLLDLLSGAAAQAAAARATGLLSQCSGGCRGGIYLAGVTMADTKGANISRMVLKQAGRAKEKVGW